MLGALFDVLKVAFGFLIVLSAWIGIQAFVRSRSSCGRDRDMLDFMLNGCGGCTRGGCANKAAHSRKEGYK